MSPQKQRIAIATACGWTTKHKGLWVEKLQTYAALPDYLNDLNACHEMEKVLTGYQQTVTYSDNLMKIVGYHTFDSAHATAAERCEAFLRVMGLWEEEVNTTKSASPTSPVTEESSATDHFRDATKMVSGESSAPTPTQPKP